MAAPAAPELASTEEFKALNGLRFPACLLIFGLHLPPWARPEHPWFDFFFKPIIAHGHIAMPFFFILSGLVLTHAYGAKVAPPGRTRPDRAGTLAFLAARVARLYPLHLVCLLLIMPIAWERGEVIVAAVLAHATLVQTAVPDVYVYDVFNKPSWSLSAELVFALAFPLLLAIMACTGARQRTALLAIGLALPFLGAAFISVVVYGGIYLLYFNPFARMVEFALGMLLYAQWRHYRWRLDGLGWEIAVLAFFLATMLLTSSLLTVYRYVAIFVPACLALTALCMAGDGPLRRLLASDAMRWLGRLAFAFYIIHYVVFSYVEISPLAQLAPDDPLRWLLPPGLLAITFLGAVALHYGVERPTYGPVRAWAMRLFSRLSSAPPATS